MSPMTVPEEGEEFPLAVRFQGERERLREEARRLSRAATALSALSRKSTWADQKKLVNAVSKAGTRFAPELRRACGLENLLLEAEQWVREAPERVKRELARELPRACQEVGLSFRVISREEPVELRIAPFSILLDWRRGQAALRFARVELLRCAARTREILAAHARLMDLFEGGVAGPLFFERCQRAWRAARAASRSSGPRVEILDFLPYLALEMQPPRFKVDPTLKNYKGYSRARFAYDILRLRRQRLLVQEGQRLNLGVATGSTASQKKRVIYFEDEQGRGEYKLTIFFTPAEEEGT